MAVIIGTELDDELFGTDDRDTIRGLGGDDLVVGGYGSDKLYGNGGNDSLAGGESMVRSAGNLLDGGKGDDNLQGGRGDDTLLGGDGNDLIWDSINSPRVGTDLVDAGQGNDWVNLNGRAGTVILGEGQDTVEVWSGAYTIDGTDPEPSVDTVDYSTIDRRVVVNLAEGFARTYQWRSVKEDMLIDVEAVVGSAGNDRLIGGNPLNDTMEGFTGGRGADTINGRGGQDMLFADQDLDGGVLIDLHQNLARDADGVQDVIRNIEDIYGTQHDDTLIGNGHDNLIGGGLGDDLIDGRGGFDMVSFRGSFLPGFAGMQIDLAAGTATGVGATQLRRIEGAYGSSLDDLIRGNGLGNRLDGGLGADGLRGRAGDDTLAGGGGDDVLVGGLGADFFSFLPGAGQDVVKDFTPGEDMIGLHQMGVATAVEALALAHQVGSSVVLDFADGSRIALLQVALTDLTTQDFAI